MKYLRYNIYDIIYIYIYILSDCSRFYSNIASYNIPGKYILHMFESKNRVINVLREKVLFSLDISLHHKLFSGTFIRKSFYLLTINVTNNVSYTEWMKWREVYVLTSSYI